MLKYFFLIIVCLNFSPLHAQQEVSAYYKMLHGEWKSWGLGDASTFYRSDSTIDTYLYGDMARAAMGFQVEVDTISPWKAGEMKYALEFQHDTLMMYTYPANEGFFEEQHDASQILVLNDSVKISVSFKRAQGIKDHIDGKFARALINKKFGKDLKGNAEIYYVGKLKDMIGKTPAFIEE
ncbi:MAG TPA: hypothetical protein PKC76_15185 [Saprospiraceae bacterium]|nr:hypothetical protein [Saprospiraceae bacterium]HMP25478.1 hypothetical protein [Saprospiraceae bacterium]